MNTENPRIEQCQKSGKECLRFVFGKRLTAADAETAVCRWRTMFQTEMGAPTVLIWDCREMKGYDSQARVQWTAALKEMKSQIDSIWLITDSNVIKMGASVMGMISSIDIKVIRAENEIEA